MARSPNCSQKSVGNDSFFIFDERSIAALKRRLFPRLSLITTPSSPRLSVLVTANPSPRWTATHLWRPQRITQIQSKHTHTLFIPTTCIYFPLFPGFCLQWKDLTFTPSSPARCSPRHFFSIARACYCSEISPRGRLSAGETPCTWNKAAVWLHYGAYRCVLDCSNRRGGRVFGTYCWFSGIKSETGRGNGTKPRRTFTSFTLIHVLLLEGRINPPEISFASCTWTSSLMLILLHGLKGDEDSSLCLLLPVLNSENWACCIELFEPNSTLKMYVSLVCFTNERRPCCGCSNI